MDTLFCIRDPEGQYTSSQIAAIVEMAEVQGYPVEHGSYLAHMTVKQLARLTHYMYDA